MSGENHPSSIAQAHTSLRYEPDEEHGDVRCKKILVETYRAYDREKLSTSGKCQWKISDTLKNRFCADQTN